MSPRVFVLSGRVQGVGCRAQIAARVRERWPELYGYVKNLPDGNVEVVALGTDEQLAELAQMLRGGLEAPVRVERVQEFESSVALGSLTLFAIVR